MGKKWYLFVEFIFFGIHIHILSVFVYWVICLNLLTCRSSLNINCHTQSHMLLCVTWHSKPPISFSPILLVNDDLCHTLIFNFYLLKFGNLFLDGVYIFHLAWAGPLTSPQTGTKVLPYILIFMYFILYIQIFISPDPYFLHVMLGSSLPFFFPLGLVVNYANTIY